MCLNTLRWCFRKNHYSKDYRYVPFQQAHFRQLETVPFWCQRTNKHFFSKMETGSSMYIYLRDPGWCLCDTEDTQRWKSAAGRISGSVNTAMMRIAPHVRSIPAMGERGYAFTIKEKPPQPPWCCSNCCSSSSFFASDRFYPQQILLTSVQCTYITMEQKFNTTLFSCIAFCHQLVPGGGPGTE